MVAVSGIFEVDTSVIDVGRTDSLRFEPHEWNASVGWRV